ncbi:hypothetical protein C8J57DRAFT_1212372 [Mycena rebaudengoi]|nr:hypothetical protein C8J57DRAFT_1212372 [Mycena rebaudengoi]
MRGSDTGEAQCTGMRKVVFILVVSSSNTTGAWGWDGGKRMEAARNMDDARRGAWMGGDAVQAGNDIDRKRGEARAEVMCARGNIQGSPLRVRTMAREGRSPATMPSPKRRPGGGGVVSGIRGDMSGELRWKDEPKIPRVSRAKCGWGRGGRRRRDGGRRGQQRRKKGAKRNDQRLRKARGREEGERGTHLLSQVALDPNSSTEMRLTQSSRLVCDWAKVARGGKKIAGIRTQLG